MGQTRIAYPRQSYNISWIIQGDMKMEVLCLLSYELNEQVLMCHTPGVLRDYI